MITATKVLTALNVIVFMFQTRYPAITSAGWKVRACGAKQGLPGRASGKKTRLKTPQLEGNSSVDLRTRCRKLYHSLRVRGAYCPRVFLAEWTPCIFAMAERC